MRDDFNDYLAFLAVAEEKSFTRAAERLNLSQSTLSLVIRRLEERLGMRLLMRTTRKVSITEVGERLVQSLTPRLNAIEEDIVSLSRFRDTPAGRIRLTVSDHMIESCIWPSLLPILKNYPDIQLELIQQNNFVDIIEGRFDAGVRVGSDIAKDMIPIKISPKWRFHVVASPEYFKENGIPNHPSDLKQHNCMNIRFTDDGRAYPWEFEKEGKEIKVKVNGQLTFSSVYPMREAVSAGYGLAYLPESMAAAPVSEGKWISVLDDWCPKIWEYYLYYPSQRQISPALSVLIDALRYPVPGKEY